MKLTQVKLENFRAFVDLPLELGDRLTLLMGENGSGKTSVIDAIAIGLGAIATHLPDVTGISFKKHDLMQTHGKSAPFARITLETTDHIKWDRMLRRDKSRMTASELPDSIGIKQLTTFLDTHIIEPELQSKEYSMPLFVSYGVGRAILDIPLTRKGFKQRYRRVDALAGALNPDTRFRSAFIWFYNKELEEAQHQKAKRSFDVTLQELDVVRRAIKAMFPDLDEPHIRVNPLQFSVIQDGQELNIDQLSDGYKTLLGLVIDLSARMAMANPGSVDPLAEEAIVMIDEVDLHLHPVWQQRVVSDLLRTFTNTQFILTTHSPYIIESMNNSLKYAKIIKTISNSDNSAKFGSIYPLDPDAVKAYWIHDHMAETILNPTLGLLEDNLITHWNEINAVYEQLRDIEWDAVANA